MDLLYLIFYACLRLRFLDVETNPDPRHPVPVVCRILCCNVRGLASKLSVMTMALCEYNMLFGLRLWSQICIKCRRYWFPWIGRHVLLCGGKMPLARGMAAYVQDAYWAFCQLKFECGCCKMLVFKVCGVRQNLYVFSFYLNPDVDDQIFGCLLASMASVVFSAACSSG